MVGLVDKIGLCLAGVGLSFLGLTLIAMVVVLGLMAAKVIPFDGPPVWLVFIAGPGVVFGVSGALLLILSTVADVWRHGA